MNTTLKKPIDWDELYPGRFLKAGELQGKRVTLTIADVSLDELEGETGKKIKGIVSFKETTKQIPLNKTNGICIRHMFGRKLPEWVGKRVTFFEGQWNGEACVRVWGSPDIPRDSDVMVQLPRKKPIKMTLHSVQRGNGAAPKPALASTAPADPSDETPPGPPDDYQSDADVG